MAGSNSNRGGCRQGSHIAEPRQLDEGFLEMPYRAPEAEIVSRYPCEGDLGLRKLAAGADQTHLRLSDCLGVQTVSSMAIRMDGSGSSMAEVLVTAA